MEGSHLHIDPRGGLLRENVQHEKDKKLKPILGLVGTGRERGGGMKGPENQ